MKKDRKELIIDYMQKHNETASVAELCEYFQVSDMTIRRDLQALEKAQKLIRHHGGATLVQAPTSQYTAESLHTRLLTNHSLKMDLGSFGAELLREAIDSGTCNSVFLASGSTLYCMASLIRFPLTNATVVTDNVNVSQALASNPSYTVIMIGGQLIFPSLNAVGHLAEKMIRSFTYDYAFIGAAAIDENGYVYTYNLIEAGTFHAIVESAKHVVVMADSSKICQKTFVQLFQLKDGFTLITNPDIPETFRSTLQSNGVRIVTEHAV